MTDKIVLIDKELILTPADSRKNIYLDFTVIDTLTRLEIDIIYEPKFYQDRVRSMALISECVERYSLDTKTDLYGALEDLLPLPNLVAFSLDMNGKYKGAAHRHANIQHIEISRTKASPGFLAGEIEKGTWRAAVNVCVVLTDTCVYRLKILGVEAAAQDGDS
jgi:hypothetical protein